MVGSIVGVLLGVNEGITVGVPLEGELVSPGRVGNVVEGALVGVKDGRIVGEAEGDRDGLLEGVLVGILVCEDVTTAKLNNNNDKVNTTKSESPNSWASMAHSPR